MLDKLTPEQEAMLSVYRDKWIKIGLCTDRVDPDAATAAVTELYRCGGLEPPTKILFANGPDHAIKLLKDLGITESITNTSVYGSHEAAWLGFYEFFQDECGINFRGKINGLLATAKNCGWVTVYDEVAVVQDRPLCIKMDENNRLHCETGPAIEYADGFKVYAWHGVRVPGDWIENRESLSGSFALKVENMEQRRAACEIVGWAKVLKDLKSKTVDKDEDPMIGELLQVNIPGVGKEKFLRVLCGTGREFAIPVPPTVKTALEANAWTFNIAPDVLKMLEVRT